MNEIRPASVSLAPATKAGEGGLIGHGLGQVHRWEG